MIVKETLHSQAYRHIKNGILNGDFKHNCIYSEQFFADYLNISRTPVREALLRLKREQYVDIFPNRGIMLKSVDAASIISVSELRTAIEGYCAAYLAEHVMTPEGQERLRICEDICRQEEELLASATHDPSTDDIHFIELDLKFHRTINDTPGNVRFLEIMSEIHSYINLLGVSVIKQENRKRESIDENYIILQAIRQGDADAAYHAARYHIDQIKRRLLENGLPDDEIIPDGALRMVEDARSGMFF